MYSAKMFAICLSFSRDRAEAEDTLQDGFIKLFDSIGQYSGKGSFEGWMKKIFINLSLEKFRNTHQLQLVEEVPDIVESDIDDTVDIPSEILTDCV